MNHYTSYLKFNYKSVRHFGHVKVRHVHAIDILSKPRTEITQKQIAFYDRLHNFNLHAKKVHFLIALGPFSNLPTGF